MVTKKEQELYRLIVAATDGSQPSIQAARQAINLARLTGAVLQVIYVINTHIAFRLGTYQNLALEMLQEEGDRAVSEVVAMAKEAGISDVNGIVLEGSPRQVIVDWAKEQGADLIVVGSRGYSAVTKIFLGSVAEYVVRHANCAVLVVRE